MHPLAFRLLLTTLSDLDKATEALAHRIATLPPSQKKQLQRIAENPLNSPLSTSSSTTSSSPMSKGRKATALGEPLVQPVHAVAAAVSGGGGGTTDAGGASKTNTMGTTTLSRSSALLRAANTSLTPGGDWSTKSTPTNAKVSAAVPACPDNALVLALNALQQQHDASSGSRQADVAVIAGTKCISAPPAAMTGTTTSAKLFDPFDARDYLTGRTSVAWSVVSALQHAAGGATGKSAPTAAMPATTLAGGAASSVTDSLVLQRSNASLMLVDSRSSGGGGGGSSFNVIGGSNGGGGGGGGTRVPRTQSSGSGGASYNLTSMGSSGSGSRIPIRSKYMSGGAGAPVRPPILRDLSLSGASLTGGQGGGFGVSEHALLNSTEELSEASVALGIPAKQQQHTSSSSSSSGKKQWMKAGDFSSPLAVPLRVQHGRHAGRGGKALSTLTSSKALKPAPHNDISSGGDLVSTTTSSQMGVGLGYASILYAGTNTMGGESVSCVSPSRGRNLKKKTIEEMEQVRQSFYSLSRGAHSTVYTHCPSWDCCARVCIWICMRAFVRIMILTRIRIHTCTHTLSSIDFGHRRAPVTHSHPVYLHIAACTVTAGVGPLLRPRKHAAAPTREIDAPASAAASYGPP